MWKKHSTANCWIILNHLALKEKEEFVNNANIIIKKNDRSQVFMYQIFGLNAECFANTSLYK
jgi:hypothetical protein